MQHTSKLILGSISNLLAGKSIALCVTGSVAAVETVHLARRLMRHGAEVHCVMSPSSQQIIHPYLLEWATGNPVVTELTGQIEHVTLAGKHSGRVDLILVAPATANTIGKVANGIDDTPVTTTVSSGIGAHIPVVVVPAMHESMYDHPAVIDNVKKLKAIGVTVISPRMEEAKAKIPSIDAIVSHVLTLVGPNDLVGKYFLVSAGPTRGWLDKIRYITNPSTGKMGIALAEEILSRGGEVTIVLGPTKEKPPDNAEVINVETSQEMQKSILDKLQSDKIDAFISAAAVLDYTPSKKEERKRPSGKPFTIELVPTDKIIEEARKLSKDLLIVGFKVESGVSDEELVARGKEKIESGICDMVVANDADREGVAFEGDTNQVIIIGKGDTQRMVPLSSKREVAKAVVDAILELL
ncbi:bifunctional phosphopantothenoylcysteine decarboxylase/phosphopantothenate--cysteine ligase CoaBC [Candidatus Thorarchaeota archaeon]|nr:MAG: bifunctional phosphopantothenoylcysteine decarboxylase/phosphopantothenate--cysteine ligase CoaBC [Candidatus Thorarchaeota archaeon]